MSTITDTAQYDVVEMKASDLGISDAVPDRIRIAYVRSGARWEPHCCVLQSAMLKSMGIQGDGLYTLRDLRPRRKSRLGWTPASRIGKYVGIVRAEFDDPDSPEAVAEKTRLARSGLAQVVRVKTTYNAN